MTPFLPRCPMSRQMRETDSEFRYPGRHELIRQTSPGFHTALLRAVASAKRGPACELVRGNSSPRLSPSGPSAIKAASGVFIAPGEFP